MAPLLHVYSIALNRSEERFLGFGLTRLRPQLPVYIIKERAQIDGNGTFPGMTGRVASGQRVGTAPNNLVDTLFLVMDQLW